MKRLLMLIPLVFMCCLGCQQGERVLVEPKDDVEADIKAIKDIIAEINAGDLDKGMSFCADDAVEIPANKPALIGKEAIRSNLQQMRNEATFQEEDVVKDIKISGNLAVAYVAWSAIVKPKTGGEPTEHNGNWIMVFEKQSNGSWMSIYSIWSDERLIYPEQVE